MNVWGSREFSSIVIDMKAETLARRTVQAEEHKARVEARRFKAAETRHLRGAAAWDPVETDPRQEDPAPS